MKHAVYTLSCFFFLLIGLCGAALLPLTGQASPLPTEVSSPLERLYVLGDFDDNDNAEIIVFGYFPHSCYKTGRTHHKIDIQTRTIDVKAISFLYSQEDGLCTDAQVPFAQKVQLGILPAGEYKVRVAGAPMMESTMVIREHTVSTPDDFLYAPVENVMLEKKEGSRSRARLFGRYPRLTAGCMLLRKVEIRRERHDIVVLRPIAEILGEEDCSDHDRLNFEVEVPLPEDLGDKSLVHVRATNGDSLNKIYFD